jgi:hypothetical protein
MNHEIIIVFIYIYISGQRVSTVVVVERALEESFLSFRSLFFVCWTSSYRLCVYVSLERTKHHGH